MNIVKLWLPVILWAGMIFVLSGIPSLGTGLEYDTIIRKTAHVIEYFILTWLLYRAIKGSFQMDYLSLFFYCFLLSFMYAVSDELHQRYVPGRNGAFSDILIDTIGILGFFIVMKFLPTPPWIKQKN